MTSQPTAPHILLVDDDEDFLYQHRSSSSTPGTRSSTASNRADAEALAAEIKPDLAILDLMMEQHDDGFVLSHHLKRLLPGLPVILVTAVTAETGLSFSPTSGAERAWVGADALLAKPIRFEQLTREVERLLDRAGTRAGADRTWKRLRRYWSSTTKRGCGWPSRAS